MGNIITMEEQKIIKKILRCNLDKEIKKIVLNKLYNGKKII